MAWTIGSLCAGTACSSGQPTQHSLKARPQSWINGVLNHSLHLGWTVALTFLSHAGYRINADYQFPWNNLKRSFVGLKAHFISLALLGILHSSAWMSSWTQPFHCDLNCWAMNEKGSGGGGKLDEASSSPVCILSCWGLERAWGPGRKVGTALEKHWTEVPHGPSQHYDSALSWVLGRLEVRRGGSDPEGQQRGYVGCVRHVSSVLSTSHVSHQSK